MTTNESFFFRDKIPFEHFRDTIVPELFAARAPQRRIRIWCAAASTGQEPYSLAMILKEMGSRSSPAGASRSSPPTCPTMCWRRPRPESTASSRCSAGCRSTLLIKYFAQIGDTWQIAPDIRAMVQFRPLNLFADFTHLGTFDVVFCRNVLIYFDQATKIDVLDRVARMLPGGRLPRARRRRDRGGADRQLQAGARAARALCAECDRQGQGRPRVAGGERRAVKRYRWAGAEVTSRRAHGRAGLHRVGSSSGQRHVRGAARRADRDAGVGRGWSFAGARCFGARARRFNQSHAGARPAGSAILPSGRLSAEIRAISSSVRQKSKTPRFSRMRLALR